MQAPKKCGDSVPVSIRDGIQAELDAARKAPQDKKPMLSRHNGIGHKLARCQQQFEKGESDIAAQLKVVAEAQQTLKDLQDRQTAKKVEIEPRQIELKATMLAVASEPPVEEEFFDLSKEQLDQGDAAEVKATVESPVIQKY